MQFGHTKHELYLKERNCEAWQIHTAYLKIHCHHLQQLHQKIPTQNLLNSIYLHSLKNVNNSCSWCDICHHRESGAHTREKTITIIIATVNNKLILQSYYAYFKSKKNVDQNERFVRVKVIEQEITIQILALLSTNDRKTLLKST